jgi:hypothetical protein
MPTPQAAPVAADDVWDTAPSLETWRRAAETIADGDPDEHCVRGLD